MSKFKLRQESLQIRDMEVTVRELSHGERNKFLEAFSTDKHTATSLVASMGCINPKMTIEEAAEEPGDVLEQIVDKILVLSHLKKAPDQKEPNAG